MHAKWTSLQRLGEEVGTHVLSLTISDYYITRIDPVFDEEVPQIEMSVRFELDCLPFFANKILL
jgi:hypothetical protein